MVYNSQAHQVFHHGWQMVMLVVRLLNISPLLPSFLADDLRCAVFNCLSDIGMSVVVDAAQCHKSVALFDFS